MLKGKLLLSLFLTLVFLLTSCITINPPASTPAPAPSSPKPATESQRPDLEAFISTPDMQPSYNIAQLAEAKAKLGAFFKGDYYANRPYVVDKYKSHDLTALKQALADMSQLPWKYKAGYFDCSEMSALVELYLQVTGFDTVIVIGRDPQIQGAGHAWVIVFLRNEAVPVEATALSIPKPTGNLYGNPPNQVVMNYGDYLRSGWVLRDIYEAVIYNPGDFDWWNSYPLSLDELFGKPPTPTPTPTPRPAPTPAPAPAPTPVKKPLSVYFEGWYVTGPAGGVKVTRVTKGSSTNALISVSDGEAGEYTMRIRRDIVGEADENVKQSTFNYDGVSGVWNLSFFPPYATSEANTNGYHLDLVKDGYTVWTLTDAYPPRLRVTLPAPAPTPTPSQYKAKVNIDETIIVAPGVWNAYQIAIDLTKMPGCRITGSFTASGGSGNDIEFLVFNESNYKKWEYEIESTTGLPTSIPALYRSGRVITDTFDISVSRSDTYYLVWSNHFSIFSNKAVRVEVYLAYVK